MIATKLIELCKEGKYLEAVESFYADNVVSIEPPGIEKDTHGKKAVLDKNQK